MSKRPTRVHRTTLWIVIAALLCGTFFQLREFPWNGNPLDWIKANGEYDEGLRYLQTKQNLMALSKFQEAARTYPSDVRFLNSMSQMQIKEGKLDDALETMQKAAALTPQLSTPHVDICQVFIAKGELAKASAACEHALKLEPANPEALALQAILLIEAGKKDESKAIMARTQSIPRDTARFWRLAGDYYALAQERELAETAFRQACSMEPQKAEYNAALGTYLGAQSDWAEAETYLHRASQFDPTNADVWTKLAFVRVKGGRPQDALEPLHNACALDPGSWLAWDRLGQIQLSLKHYPQAVTSMQRVVELSPEHDVCWNRLIDAWAGCKKYSEARLALTTYMASTPYRSRQPAAWATMGEMFRREKRYDEAKVSFNKALALKPDKAVEREIQLTLKSLPTGN